MSSTGKSSVGQNQPGVINSCQLITCSFRMHKRGWSGAASTGTSCVAPSRASLFLDGQIPIAQLGGEFRRGMCGAHQAQHWAMSSCLLGNHMGGQARPRLSWAPVPVNVWDAVLVPAGIWDRHSQKRMDTAAVGVWERWKRNLVEVPLAPHCL